MVSGSGTGTNCPISPPWPLLSDGEERARRRRTAYHITTMVIKAAPTIPPTTPPAISPAFELVCEAEAGDEPPDELGVMVDCDTRLVDVGEIKDVPVSSGESRQDEYICVYQVQGPPIAPPMACAAEKFHASACNGTVDRHFLGEQAKGSYRCVDVCPLGYSRVIGDRFGEAVAEGCVHERVETTLDLRSGGHIGGAFG